MSKKYSQGTITVSSLSNPHKYVGKIKNNITFRSSWELSFMKFCDRTDTILEWSSEEKIIIYTNPLDHKKHRYFMDFYIKYKSNRNIIEEGYVEIKPYNQAKFWIEKTFKPALTSGMSDKSKKYVIETFITNKAKWEATEKECKQKEKQLF